MKGKIKILLATSFAFTLLVSSALSTSAAKNDVIKADFESASSFTALGDLDNDTNLASSDLVLLRKILIKDATEGKKAANVNLDQKVDLKDLVRLKKDIAAAKKPAYVKDGALILDGAAVYNGELVSLLKPNTEYQVSYTFTSDTGVNVTFKGADVSDATFNSKSGKSKYFSHILKTGEELTENNGYELILSGKGTIDNIVVTEIVDTWSDGDTAEQGGNDIF